MLHNWAFSDAFYARFPPFGSEAFSAGFPWQIPREAQFSQPQPQEVLPASRSLICFRTISTTIATKTSDTRIVPRLSVSHAMCLPPFARVIMQGLFSDYFLPTDSIFFASLVVSVVAS